jgi:hypothetical protein
MRNLLFLLMLSFVFCAELQADDTKHFFSIQEALDSKAFEGRLNKEIKFYFGSKPDQRISKNLGDFVTNKKTNAFLKDDRTACEWVFLSALLSLQKRVVAEGGNAVINIRSFYKKNEMSSETKFECHVGLLMAGVALKGTVVYLD